jgi:hypothetical protein
MNFKPVVRVTLSIFVSCASANALAQWAPVWTGIGEHPHPPPVRMSPVDLRIAPDGGVFAGIDSTYQNAAHAGLIRFDSNGAFAWLNEREEFAWTGASVELLSSGRVAMIGETFLDEDRAVFVRVVDGTSGELVWQRESAVGRLWLDERHDTRQVAETPDGNLMVRLAQGGDFVVLRIAGDGTLLPEWRWTSGLESVFASDIAATPDGGAVVAGYGGLQEGFRTVRFDANGRVIFDDVELGEIGNPLGPARVRIDTEGAAIVVASPETLHGVPGAMAWKIDPTGKRVWTVELSDQSSTTTTFANGSVALAPDDDALVVADNVPDPHMRVIRLEGETGAVALDYASDVEASNTLTLALAGNGRVLVGGCASIPGSGGQVTSRVVEFTADGLPCRLIESTVPSATHDAEWSADGWYMLGTEIGVGLYVRKYDATGPCDTGADDLIFANGFE